MEESDLDTQGTRILSRSENNLFFRGGEGARTRHKERVSIWKIDFRLMKSVLMKAPINPVSAVYYFCLELIFRYGRHPIGLAHAPARGASALGLSAHFYTLGKPEAPEHTDPAHPPLRKTVTFLRISPLHLYWKIIFITTSLPLQRVATTSIMIANKSGLSFNPCHTILKPPLRQSLAHLLPAQTSNTFPFSRPQNHWPRLVIRSIPYHAPSIRASLWSILSILNSLVLTIITFSTVRHCDLNEGYNKHPNNLPCTPVPPHDVKLFLPSITNPQPTSRATNSSFRDTKTSFGKSYRYG